MTSAVEIVEAITSRGGQLWLDGQLLRYRLPATMGPMVDTLRTHKPEIVELLEQRPVMPLGVRLLSYQPKEPPVKLSQCETVVDTGKFIQSTLRQVDARLHGKKWLAGNLPLSGLVERLAAVGCVIELADRKAMLQ
ncbi:MAG: hypothetical protein ACYCOX_02175 [Acidobacteriaceae bacterium]